MECYRVVVLCHFMSYLILKYILIVLSFIFFVAIQQNIVIG